MAGDPYKPDYDYVAYVDEAGDPGLKQLRPEHAAGSSEWFVLSAVVVQKAHEFAVRDWVVAIIEAAGRRQRKYLHFRALHEGHKRLACSMLASKQVRCFAIASHKKSLLDWPHNPSLPRMRNRDWFYAFLSRYLLERVTHFVADHSKRTCGSVRRVKVIFSDRGGLNVAQMNAYYEKLKHQHRAGTTILNRGNLVWDSFHHSLMRHASYRVSAGLQLADIVASSFFTACDQYNTLKCDPAFALLLRDRMARAPDKRKGQISGYGVKVLPKFEPGNWLPVQSQVFREYGYPMEWWDPVPPNPPYFK
jgi:hypothetical protein